MRDCFITEDKTTLIPFDEICYLGRRAIYFKRSPDTPVERVVNHYSEDWDRLVDEFRQWLKCQGD